METLCIRALIGYLTITNTTFNIKLKALIYRCIKNAQNDKFCVISNIKIANNKAAKTSLSKYL